MDRARIQSTPNCQKKKKKKILKKEHSWRFVLCGFRLYYEISVIQTARHNRKHKYVD